MNDAYGTETDVPGGEGGGGIIAYLPSILWQRRWWIIVPLVLCTIGTMIHQRRCHRIDGR
ncbi:MAG: hypothetical protein EOP67_71900 [Sphingomonas sp.]|nr:MAG: hypothetical protein EOP67_71900 [Sphingomonas sp.]